MNLLTKRIPTILGLVLLVAGIFGAYFYFSQITPPQVLELAPDKVRITNIADNKFSVSWVTGIATTGSIEYGKVGDKLTSIKNDDRDSVGTAGLYTTHHVTLESLQPNTQYAFRILSGDKPTRYDNNGAPYITSTGPVVGATPGSINFYGKVEHASKQPAGGSLVYVTLPGGSTASTIVSDVGNYVVTLSTIRSSDLGSYVKYDPIATVVSVTVESGKLQSIASVSMTNSAPVPTITLGQDAEFMTVAEKPAIAEIAPDSSAQTIPETPSIFNVEPLAGTPDINAVGSESVTILNPRESGETLATLRPEFRGTGPRDITLSIALTGQKAISDTLKIASDGTWSWAPVIDLKVGKQKVAVSYVDSVGSTQKVERDFNVSAAKVGIDPAFVSSPSGSIASNSANVETTATSSSTPRTTMPDTSEGTPVTGVIENTLLTGALGIVIMVIGAVLLAL